MPRRQRSGRRPTPNARRARWRAEAGRLGASVPLDAPLASVWEILDPAAAFDRASVAVRQGQPPGLRGDRPCVRLVRASICGCGDDGRRGGACAVHGSAPTGRAADRPALPAPGLRALRPGALRDRPDRARPAVLLANLEVGFRADPQPEITEALDAGELRRTASAILESGDGGDPTWLGRPRPLDVAI